MRSINNEDEALLYHTLATEKEDIKSQLYFADKHLAEKDPHCVKWFETVLLNESRKNEYEDVYQAKTRAYQVLGICYYTGTFVTKNYEKAFEMFKLANSDTDLAKCYASGKGIQKDLKIAEELLRKSCGDHATNLAKYYEYEEIIKGIECGDLIVT